MSAILLVALVVGVLVDVAGVALLLDVRGDVAVTAAAALDVRLVARRRALLGGDGGSFVRHADLLLLRKVNRRLRD
jgi:hypothetical protein